MSTIILGVFGIIFLIDIFIQSNKITKRVNEKEVEYNELIDYEFDLNQKQCIKKEYGDYLLSEQQKFNKRRNIEILILFIIAIILMVF